MPTGDAPLLLPDSSSNHATKAAVGSKGQQCQGDRARGCRQPVLLSLVKGGPAPNGGQLVWGLSQLSLGTHQAWSSATSSSFPPQSPQGQMGSCCQILPLNPSPELGHFSGLLWRSCILSPSPWRHDTSQHNPSPVHYQHSLGRETTAGRGPAGTGQREHRHGAEAGAGEARQAVLMAPQRVAGPCVH